MDDPQLEDFCRREHPRLVGSLTLMCGDRGVAEELAQEALARTWAQWSKVRNFDSPQGWLYRIAFNLSRSYWRRKRAEHRARDRAAQSEPISDELERSALSVEVGSAIRQLPARQRTVVVLHYYLEYSLAEIAEVLDLPPSTVRSLAARARDRLRNELEPTGEKETGYVT